MRYAPLFQSYDYYVFRDEAQDETYFVGVYRSGKASAIIPILMSPEEVQRYKLEADFLKVFNEDIATNTGNYLERFAYGTVEQDSEARRLIEATSFPKKKRWSVFGFLRFFAVCL
ncbi:MAG: hypothetical protein NTX25_14255 [Proteobacteria bacterium]|nr:hypothetical protein [Pseudomonadota bacterium]